MSSRLVRPLIIASTVAASFAIATPVFAQTETTVAAATETTVAAATDTVAPDATTTAEPTGGVAAGGGFSAETVIGEEGTSTGLYVGAGVAAIGLAGVAFAASRRKKA